MMQWSTSQKRAWAALNLGPVWEPLPRRGSQEEVQPNEVPQQTGVEMHARSAERSSGDAPLRWEDLRAEVAACRACPLGHQRKQAVFGSGSTAARWAIVGEAPGAEEDERGEAFVGQAGRLLDAMLASMGWVRSQDFFIANVLKCRPPGNRTPAPTEVAACAGHLQAQLLQLEPLGLLILGRIAAAHLLGSNAPLAHLRGRIHLVRSEKREIPAVVTFHPAYLLRSPQDKAKTWEDLNRFAALQARATEAALSTGR
jgi:DNA polymerase